MNAKAMPATDTNGNKVILEGCTKSDLTLLQMEVKRPSRMRRFLVRRVPIVSWLPQYSADKAISDLIAGVTVGLTLMPQGLAYAVLAGLEPQVRNHKSDVLSDKEI